MNIWQFMGDHPFLTFFLALILAGLVKAPFQLCWRYIRSRNIQQHGWPPKPFMDADGDIVYPKKED